MLCYASRSSVAKVLCVFMCSVHRQCVKSHDEFLVLCQPVTIWRVLTISPQFYSEKERCGERSTVTAVDGEISMGEGGQCDGRDSNAAESSNEVIEALRRSPEVKHVIMQRRVMMGTRSYEGDYEQDLAELEEHARSGRAHGHFPGETDDASFHVRRPLDSNPHFTYAMNADLLWDRGVTGTPRGCGV